MYNSLLIDQSIALNRRRDDEGDVKTEDLNLGADDHENEVLWWCLFDITCLLPVRKLTTFSCIYFISNIMPCQEMNHF